MIDRKVCGIETRLVLGIVDIVFNNLVHIVILSKTKL